MSSSKSGQHFSEMLYVTHAQAEAAPLLCKTLLDAAFTPGLHRIKFSISISAVFSGPFMARDNVLNQQG